MSYQTKFSKKFLAFTLTAALVGGSIAPSISAAGFKDVEAGKWYSEAINVLSDKAIINGMGEGLFMPKDKMTKAQVVKMIAVAKDLDTEEVASPEFSDVKEGAWYYKYVAAAKEAGIVLGDGTGKFDPNKEINRAEMASLLVKAYDLDGKDTEIDFKDVKTSDWFYDEVQALVASGLTNGTSDTTYSPKASLLRAQGAEFVHRAITKEATDAESAINQLIFDINHIEGEGNLADKFVKLNNENFNGLSEVQQTEVAKLFLINKADTVYTTVDEIVEDLEAAIVTYTEILGTVNEAADATEMKAALEAIASLFDIEVTNEMAALIFAERAEDGYVSVSAMIDVLQAAIDAQFVFDVNRIEGEGNLADKFAEYGHDAFEALTEVQQMEVAKLFLISKADTVYTTVDEIVADLETAIETYEELLAAVNNSADETALKAALEDIADLFEITVTDEIATKVFEAKTDDGFDSVTAIIAALQATE